MYGYFFLSLYLSEHQGGDDGKGRGLCQREDAWVPFALLDLVTTDARDGDAPIHLHCCMFWLMRVVSNKMELTQTRCSHVTITGLVGGRERQPQLMKIIGWGHEGRTSQED